MSLPRPVSTYREWLVEPLQAEVKRSLERLRRAEDVRHIAVMPDVHLCEDVCIGTVVATSERILPRAVGNDIGCGMATVRLDVDAKVLDSEIDRRRILNGLRRMVPANRHSTLSAPEILPESLMHQSLSTNTLERLKKRTARVQLGTLGRGNHFLEFQSDDAGRLWILTHSGSRGMGQAISDFHRRQCRRSHSGIEYLNASSSIGQAYLQDAAWAYSYAAENRRAIIESTEAILRTLFRAEATASTFLQCHHNHVHREQHFGEDLWVHRKGALSARDGELGIIPGSMATESFHVEGRGCSRALCSSSHGAGRTLSRTAARRAMGARRLIADLRHVHFDPTHAEAVREESPAAYNDIGKVLRAQKSLTRIVRRLRPVWTVRPAML